jgi:hypothetical protein
MIRVDMEFVECLVDYAFFNWNRVLPRMSV